MWYQIASHLRTPVEELQHRISYTEFLEWKFYLDREDAYVSPMLQSYLANIAAEIRRSYVSNPGKIKMNDFILKYGDASAPARQSESKAAWLTVLGVDPDKKGKGRGNR